MTQKSEAAAQREIAVLERSTLVERGPDGKAEAVTENGRTLVEKLARSGAPQSKIASRLGIPLRRLKTLLDRNQGDNDLRLAWEAGHSDFEFEMVKKLLRHGVKNPIPLLFLAKSQLGWRETDKDPNAPNVTSNVVISLPGAMKAEDYYRTLGITGPVPATNLKNATPERPPGVGWTPSLDTKMETEKENANANK